MGPQRQDKQSLSSGEHYVLGNVATVLAVFDSEMDSEIQIVCEHCTLPCINNTMSIHQMGATVVSVGALVHCLPVVFSSGDNRHIPRTLPQEPQHTA